MAPKVKQTIDLKKLIEIGKATLKEPNATLYNSEDLNVVVGAHYEFFLAIAPHTQRINPISLSILAKDLFRMEKREGHMYGQGLAAAFSHCMQSGAKATTGAKLDKRVLSVYKASGLGQRQAVVKGEVKQEPGSLKVKMEEYSPPMKKMKVEFLDSPTQIAALYAGSFSSSSGMQDIVFFSKKS